MNPWHEPVQKLEEREGQLEARFQRAVGLLVAGYLILFLGAGVGAWRLDALIGQVQRDGEKQVRQFCELNVAKVVDRERQVVATQAYLSTPAGMEATGLNEYIRHISFPTLKKQVVAERRQLPDDCIPIYRRLHREALSRLEPSK